MTAMRLAEVTAPIARLELPARDENQRDQRRLKAERQSDAQTAREHGGERPAPRRMLQAPDSRARNIATALRSCKPLMRALESGSRSKAIEPCWLYTSCAINLRVSKAYVTNCFSVPQVQWTSSVDGDAGMRVSRWE